MTAAPMTPPGQAGGPSPDGLPPMPVRSAEQDQFAASLHDMLGTSAPAAGGGPGGGGGLAAARRWADGDHEPGLALWRNLAGLGVTGLAVPARWGGLGASAMDLVVACEEAGHHALPGPVAESLAAVPALLTALGDDRLCDQWLPGLAEGEVIATLAAPPGLPYALDADVAGLVLLAGPVAVRAATAGTRHPSVDPARWLFEVTAGPALAEGPAAAAAFARALDLGALATAAQLLGAGRALLEASVTHVGQRTQFGRPIGAFQAVQHHLADVAIALEFARPLLYAAALTLTDGGPGNVPDGGPDNGPDNGPDTARDISAAKVACADAAHRAARTALQVHGAIGYTREHDLSLWLTKVRALIPAWGTQAEHRARVMAALSRDEESAWN
jgi:alkylation response protein AidB-like acyl-CoA dehydrogenase